MGTGAKGSTAQDTENWRWKRTTGRVREAAMGAGAKGSRAQDRDRSGPQGGGPGPGKGLISAGKALIDAEEIPGPEKRLP